MRSRLRFLHFLFGFISLCLGCQFNWGDKVFDMTSLDSFSPTPILTGNDLTYWIRLCGNLDPNLCPNASSSLAIQKGSDCFGLGSLNTLTVSLLGDPPIGINFRITGGDDERQANINVRCGSTTSWNVIESPRLFYTFEITSPAGCSKKPSCQFNLANKTYDLTSLDSFSPTPILIDNSTYWIRLCGNLDPNLCQGATASLAIQNRSSCFGLGDSNSLTTSLLGDPPIGINFEVAGGDGGRQANINVICGSPSTSWSVLENPTFNFNFDITSPAGCPIKTGCQFNLANNTYDMTPLDTFSRTPILTGDGFTYWIRLCGNLDPNLCRGATPSLAIQNGSSCVGLGSLYSLTSSLLGDPPVGINFRITGGDGGRQANINVRCGSTTTSWSVIENPTFNFNFDITSPAGCPTNPSIVKSTSPSSNTLSPQIKAAISASVIIFVLLIILCLLYYYCYHKKKLKQINPKKIAEQHAEEIELELRSKNSESVISDDPSRARTPTQEIKTEDQNHYRAVAGGEGERGGYEGKIAEEGEGEGEEDEPGGGEGKPRGMEGETSNEESEPIHQEGPPPPVNPEYER